jgi:hypothetical protein
MDTAVEHLPSKHAALCSNPSTTETETQTNKPDNEEVVISIIYLFISCVNWSQVDYDIWWTTLVSNQTNQTNTVVGLDVVS